MNLLDAVKNSPSAKILFNSSLQSAGGLSFARKVLFAVAIIFILTYGVIILYYYHNAKNEEETKSLEFTHQVLWGYAGTPGILQVAAQSIVTLLTILISIFAFKKFMSHNEALLNTAKEYISATNNEDNSDIKNDCKQKLEIYKTKLKNLKEHLDKGGSIIASNSAQMGRNLSS